MRRSRPRDSKTVDRPPLIFKFISFFLCKLNKKRSSHIKIRLTHYYLLFTIKNLLILTLADYNDKLRDAAVINAEDIITAIPDVDDDDADSQSVKNVSLNSSVTT